MDRPSILAFGPQERCPNAEVIRQLRDVLENDRTFAGIVTCLKQLDSTWTHILEKDDRLRSIPGIERVYALQLLLLGDSDKHDEPTANQITMPLTILVHMIQYRQFIQHSSHASVIQDVAAGGVQGFCAGLLSAYAVSSMSTEDDFDACAAFAIKLAMTIGAYIDLAMVLNNQQTASAVVRWSVDSGRQFVDQTIARYESAYVSTISDDSIITVTAKQSDLTAITASLGSLGMSGKTLALTGSFHTSQNAEILQRILALLHSPILEPPRGTTNSLVRSNSTGDLLSGSETIESILQDILCNVADWRLTMNKTADSLATSQEQRAIIYTFGTVEFMPVPIKTRCNVRPQRLQPTANSSQTEQPGLKYQDDAIAIVGMACRFPGADSLDEFWDLLQSGRSMHERMPADRFSTIGLRRSADGAPFWGNFLKDIDAFDNRFFKKSSREAASMDPQQRLLLQCAYIAMESAGYFAPSAEAKDRDIGVYVGACSNDYNDNVASHKPTAYSTLGTLKAFLTGRISHWFDLTGPSVVYDTACSSSAVAIDAACKAILSGDCSQALAGGVSLYTSPNFYQNLDTASFLSQTGPCKPFDAKADGYCRGEGVGLVVLKKLSEAIRCGDKIEAVIAGTGVNQNRNCTGITVPHGASQADLYRRVVAKSGIEASQVSYVEAHGTGTPVGDPIEHDSIRSVFADSSTKRQDPLAIASVKGSIGHLEGAAGVASLIKVCLMMKHSAIPPQANFTKINPKLKIDENVIIPTSTRPWNAKQKVACINNYGAAGSNAAMIVCQAPEQKASVQARRLTSNLSFPIAIYGDGVDAVEANRRAILEYAQDIQRKQPGQSVLSSLAHALSSSQNRSLSHAAIATVSESTNLEKALSGAFVAARPTKSKPVVLCFGGQVKSFVGLDQELFDNCALLQQHLHQCDAAMQSLDYPSLFPAMFKTEPIEDLVQLHGMLFALQYSSAKAWLDCGLRVDALIGHSFGQLTALTVGGALSLVDGLKIVCGRAQLIKELWGPTSGAMIAIEAPLSDIEAIISQAAIAGHEVEIACYNARTSHVLVGTSAAIDEVEKKLQASGNKHKRLPVTHGFHSAFTEPILSGLGELARGVTFRTPTIPIETCTESESWAHGTPELIVQHTRRPVYFVHAVERLSARLGNCVWLEASTGASTPAMVKRCLPQPGNDIFVYANLGTSGASGSLAEATANLWRANQQVQFWSFHAIQRSSYLSFHLPGYQFRQTKHWLEWRDTVIETVPKPVDTAAVSEKHELLTFSSFEDTSKTVAEFRVDPQSDEFTLLVKGHAVVAEPLCPAPLYCELAVRAVKSLTSQTGSKTPEIRDLQIHAPLGLVTDRIVRLIVSRNNAQDSWSFTLESSMGGSDKSTHANGTVLLRETEYELSSYQRLVGHQKIQDLSRDPSCDALKGSTTYKLFSRVVTYAPYYKGVQAVFGRDLEACGTVCLPTEHGTKIAVPLLIDNFFQVAGLHVNVLGDCEDHLVFVCTETQRMVMGAGLGQSPAARYDVYSTFSRNGTKEVVCDIVAFDAETKAVQFVGIGARFNRVTIEGLRKVLRGAQHGSAGTAITHNKVTMPSANTSTEVPVVVVEKTTKTATPEGPAVVQVSVAQPVASQVDLLPQVKTLLNKVSDIEVTKIQADSSLDDLGIDSLMVMEVQTEVQSQFKLTIPAKDWATLETPGKLAAYLQSATNGNTAAPISSTLALPASSSSSSSGHDSDHSSNESDSDESFDSGICTPNVETAATTPGISKDNYRLSFKPQQPSDPVNVCAQRAFSEVGGTYDAYAAQEGFAGFWKNVYPTQRRLTLAYVVEAFQQMGCDLTTFAAGQVLPSVTYLPEHKLLVKQLYEILGDADLVNVDEATITRTATAVDNTPSADLLKEIIHSAPQHAEEHKLLAVTGSRLGDCLTGRADPLRLLFMDRQNKGLLESVYANGPMYKAMSRLLGAYLLGAVSRWQGRRPLRILEIGGGTGGTTKHIVAMLQQQGIDFEYTFTDLSRGLVSNAKRIFSAYPQMKFIVLDVETAPENEHRGQYDLIISTNCIHATKNLETTGKHMRQMLNNEGFICLVEFTRNIFWFDLVFGLLDGWWLFEDGRTHVLADEKFWDKSLRAAGFGDVQWTDGQSEESKTLRLITAFNSSGDSARPQGVLKPSGRRRSPECQTVRWKQEADLDLMADVYLPSGASSSSAARPVALMLHGGGHVLHTRKHINPRHVTQLLDLGFLPVSVDYRLCPEINIRDGPMTDACDAVAWARNALPTMPVVQGVRLDAERLVVVGYSTGGHLSLTTAFTTLNRGIKPPTAILGFYCPTDYCSDWWRSPIYPSLAQQESTEPFDLLEGVEKSPIAGYSPSINRNVAALLMSLEDPRWRFVLHMNWRAQTLPVLLNGLPPKSSLKHNISEIENMPIPDHETVASISPYEQILRGNYNTPTYLLHGTEDCLIPWQQSQNTIDALRDRGVDAEVQIIKGAEHVFDTFSNRWSEEVSRALVWLAGKCDLV